MSVYVHGDAATVDLLPNCRMQAANYNHGPCFTCKEMSQKQSFPVAHHSLNA